MSVEQDLFSDDIQARVRFLLSKYAFCRDNDKMLWLYYADIFCDLSGVVKGGNFKYFDSWLMDDRVPTFESLSRCRRKLQEKYPQLRGTKYKEKKESAQRIAERINVD